MDTFINFFKTLSDETRLRILMALKAQAFCVCELCELFDESQPKISKHLSKLKDLGFVKTTRKDQYIYYHLNVTDKFHETALNLIEENTVLSSQLEKDQERIKMIKNRPFTCTLKEVGTLE